MREILIPCLLLCSICRSQINTQPLIEKGYSIASKSDSEIVTNPMQIYGATNFFILIRLHVKADTVTGEYTTTHKAHYSGNFVWSPITDRHECKKSWPVYKDFLIYWKQQQPIK